MTNNKVNGTKVRSLHTPIFQWIWVLLVILIFAISLYFDSFLETDPLIPDSPISLESGWTLTREGEVTASNITLPLMIKEDVEAEEIRVSSLLPTTIPENFSCVSVSTSMTSLDVLLDDVMVYSFHGDSTPWNKPILGGGFTHFVRLPGNIEGKRLTLIYNFTSNNSFSGSIEKPYLGTKASLILKELIEWPSLIFGGMFFIIGIAAIVISFKFSEGLERKSIRYFGLIESSFGAWVATQTSAKFFIIRNPILPLNFSILALFLLPYFLIRYVNTSYRIVKRKTKGFLYASYLFILAYIVGGVGQIFGWFEYTDLIPFAGLSLGVFIVFLTIVVLIDYFEGNRELITFIYAVGVLLITVAAEEGLLLLSIFIEDAVILHLGMSISGGILLFQTLRVISQQRQSTYKEQKLLELAYTDSLTGLNNRMAYDNQIETIMKHKKNYDVIGVIVCDINDLKKMNDTYGHSCGDEILKDFAYQIVKIVPYGTDLYRIGGDEFVAFIPRITEEQLNLIADTIRTSSLRVSVGPYTVAVGEKRCVFTGPCNLLNVIIEADKKMYTCKKAMKKLQSNSNI